MLLAAHIERVSVSHLRDFPPYIGYILNIYANNTAQSLVLWQQATLGLFLLWQDLYKPGHFPRTHEDHVPMWCEPVCVFFTQWELDCLYLFVNCLHETLLQPWLVYLLLDQENFCMFVYGFASCMIPLMVINVYYMCNSKIALVT